MVPSLFPINSALLGIPAPKSDWTQQLICTHFYQNKPNKMTSRAISAHKDKNWHKKIITNAFISSERTEPDKYVMMTGAEHRKHKRKRLLNIYLHYQKTLGNFCGIRMNTSLIYWVAYINSLAADLCCVNIKQ